MLGTAHEGLGQRRGVNLCIGDVKIESAHFGYAYREVQVAERSGKILHFEYKTAHSGYETVCLPLWLEVCSTLKILLKLDKTRK